MKILFCEFWAELNVKSDSIKVFMNFSDGLINKDFQRKGTKFGEWIVEGFSIEVNNLNKSVIYIIKMGVL